MIDTPAVLEVIFAAFGVWILWSLASVFLEAPEWAWRVAAIVVGIGAMILIDADRWWLGVAIGGFAAFLMLVADLLLVTADWVRVTLLRTTRR